MEEKKYQQIMQMGKTSKRFGLGFSEEDFVWINIIEPAGKWGAVIEFHGELITTELIDKDQTIYVSLEPKHHLYIKQIKNKMIEVGLGFEE